MTLPSQPDQTETIGRLPHLLTHIAAQFPGLSTGADTFEDVRQRYGRAMNTLAARGQRARHSTTCRRRLRAPLLVLDTRPHQGATGTRLDRRWYSGALDQAGGGVPP